MSAYKIKIDGAEYLASTSIFPPKELIEQAVARSRSPIASKPSLWNDWQDALNNIQNDVLTNFINEELADGRENYLNSRRLYFRISGKRRFQLSVRK